MRLHGPCARRPATTAAMTSSSSGRSGSAPDLLGLADVDYGRVAESLRAEVALLRLRLAEGCTRLGARDGAVEAAGAALIACLQEEASRFAADDHDSRDGSW